MSYLDKLVAIQRKNRSWLCLGLDPDPALLPPEHVARYDEPVLPFNKAIINATADLVCAYKPNLGFYLQWGAAGIIALERTIKYIPKEIPIILDCKTGDIGHTQLAWAKGLFEEWGVDGMTVNPYVGEEAVRPLSKRYPDKAIYLLARTSNPSAPQLQGTLRDEHSVGMKVLKMGQSWQEGGHVGFVIGATYPDELKIAREVAPHANFLIPGVGTQGGDLAAAMQYGADSVAGPLINVGRAVLYASRGFDFADAARRAVLTFREQMV